MVAYASLSLVPSVDAGRLAFGAVRRSPPNSFLHEAFVTPLPHNNNNKRRRWLATSTSEASSVPLSEARWIHRIRGGARAVAEEVDTDESESEEEEEEEEESEADDEEEEESDDEQEEDDDDDEDSRLPSTSAAISSQPVAMTVKTSLGNAVLDQSIELNVNQSRDIASLKDSLRRQLPGRPPVAAMQLLFQGRILPNDMLVHELVDDEDEEDDEDEDEDEEEEGSSGPKLTLTLDMVPPVDPKFVPLLEQQMQDMTAAQLLDAYAANEAAMYHNAALLMESAAAKESVDHHHEEDSDNEEDEEDEADEDTVSDHSNEEPPPLVGIQLREQASRIRQDLEEQLLSTEHAQQLLANPLTPAVAADQAHEAIQIRGDRVRQAAVTGVRTSIKRQIQHNLNIAWADSVRYFVLFLFFGWFGGRTPTSRAILLLGAPSVFLLQARPVKLVLKQAVYTLLDHPPSILLSLLPAPQQAILSLNVASTLQTIYGDMLLLNAAGSTGRGRGGGGRSTRTAATATAAMLQEQQADESEAASSDSEEDEEPPVVFDDEEEDEEFFDAEEGYSDEGESDDDDDYE